MGELILLIMSRIPASSHSRTRESAKLLPVQFTQGAHAAFSVGDTVIVFNMNGNRRCLAKIVKKPALFDDEIPRQWQTTKNEIQFLDSGKPGYRTAEEMMLHDGTSDRGLSSDSSDTVIPRPARRLPTRVAQPIPDRLRSFESLWSADSSPNSSTEYRVSLMNKLYSL